MKLLHTSDWHVGKALRGHSRADEHRAVLDEIASIVERESVDLVVVAGDLFDSSAPAPESEEIVYKALLALGRTGATVAVVAGNHDSARRLHAVSPIFELGNVHVVAEPTRPDDGGVLATRARDDADVRIAMLPFVSKRGIVRSEHLIDQEAFQNAQLYSERMRLLVDALCGRFASGTVNVLAAHTYVLGAVSGGGERPAHLVDEYAVPAQAFPPSINYAALGHLHRPQRIAGGAPLHYCGSPLQLDFGETDPKQVNVVCLEPGLPADVQSITLTSGRQLRTIRGTLDELQTAATASDHSWLRVVVDGPVQAGVANRVRELFGERVVDIRTSTPTVATGRVGTDHRQRSPQELFDEYIRHQGFDDERVRSLFGELLDADHDEVVV